METTTRPYDVAESLRTPEEMADYLEACIEAADGDAAFIAKALGGCRTGSGNGPNCPRHRSFSGQSLQSALRRAQSKLRHYSEGCLATGLEVERQCQRGGRGSLNPAR